MPRETRGNLLTIIRQYKMIYQTMDAPTHIPEILCWMILRISIGKLLGIVSRSTPISNFCPKSPIVRHD